MNIEMARRWNMRVQPEDTVYHLGDFAFGDKSLWKGFREKLNGRIILVTGNHDRDKKWNILPEILNAGFDEIHENLHIEVDGWKLWLHHIPLSTAPDKRGYERSAPEQDYDIALCGHCHDKFLVNDLGNINVGCDLQDFYPRTLEELLEAASKAPIFDSSTFLPV